jgi:hypothetical protein
MAQYSGGCDIFLAYFMVTDDYTGYRLLYEPDFRDKNGDSSERGEALERMITSFKITK